MSWRIRALASISVVRRAVLARYRNAFPGIYEYHIARTHYIDQFVLREVADGAKQLVLLGAGFDTRPLRMLDALSGVRVLELDHPATSRRKQARLTRIGATPQNVTFVPVDFEREDLLPALEAVGYRNDLRTIFVWEGVSMFLTGPAVTSTLRAIACAESNSAVVFDHISRAVAEGRYANLYGSREAARYLAAQGEPYKFGLEPDEVRSFLAHHGLSLECWQNSRELGPQYLCRSDGQLLGQVNDFHALAVARPARQIRSHEAAADRD